MRVGFDAKRAFLNTSGLGNYSRNTLNALKYYFSENDYVLFTPEVKAGLLENPEAFEIVSPPKERSNFQKSLWRAYRMGTELGNHQLDLFHGLSNELPKGIQKTKVASVVTIHDLIFIRYPHFYKPFDRAIYKRKVSFSCAAADRIIAISQQTKDDIIAYFNVEADKIVILHQSVSPVFFEKMKTAEIKKKYKLPDEFILSVGTIEERKNQLSILKAALTEKIDMPVVFVGNPTSYCNDIHKYIAANGLEKQVVFLKNIPESDLAGLYQLAKLSIYISVFEGFGLPVIESMACGCPVITSNVSCLPETAGGAGILCNPNDIDQLGISMRKVLNDKAFCKDIIQRGKTRAEDFKPQKYARNLISLYADISR